MPAFARALGGAQGFKGRKSLVFLVLAVSTARMVMAGSTTVPIQLLGNFPVITVQIDGTDVPLIFDLPDESALALAPGVVDRIRTEPAGERHRARDAVGNVIQSSTFKVSQIHIGDVVFQDAIGRPDLHDPSYQAAEVGQRGYLGTALLSPPRSCSTIHAGK